MECKNKDCHSHLDISEIMSDEQLCDACFDEQLEKILNMR